MYHDLRWVIDARAVVSMGILHLGDSEYQIRLLAAIKITKWLQVIHVTWLEVGESCMCGCFDGAPPPRRFRMSNTTAGSNGKRQETTYHMVTWQGEGETRACRCLAGVPSPRRYADTYYVLKCGRTYARAWWSKFSLIWNYNKTNNILTIILEIILKNVINTNLY